MKTNLITSACFAAALVLASCTNRNDPSVDNTTANTYQSTPGATEPANAGSNLDTINTHGHTTSLGTTSAPNQHSGMSGQGQSVGSTGSATGAE